MTPLVERLDELENFLLLLPGDTHNHLEIVREARDAVEQLNQILVEEGEL